MAAEEASACNPNQLLLAAVRAAHFESAQGATTFPGRDDFSLRCEHVQVRVIPGREPKYREGEHQSNRIWRS